MKQQMLQLYASVLVLQQATRVVAVVFATRYCCRYCSGQYRGIHGHRRLAGVVVHRVDLGVGG